MNSLGSLANYITGESSYPIAKMIVNIMYDRERKEEVKNAIGLEIIDERRDTITVIGSPYEIMKHKDKGIMIISWKPLEGESC
jgi:hypothetical protein